MALTITQELQLLNEGEKVGTGIGSEVNPISELIYQSAIGKVISISSNAKDVDSELNPNAANYLRKISNVGLRVLNKDNTTLDTLRKVFVSLVGDSAFTFAQVSNANEETFITFINSNIDKMFEVVGGVYPAEKTEYNSL